MQNRHGFAVENLVEVTVVTGTGEIKTGKILPSGKADDLLWSCRGGVGNTGVVVSLVLRCYPMDFSGKDDQKMLSMTRVMAPLGGMEDHWMGVGRKTIMLDYMKGISADKK